MIQRARRHQHAARPAAPVRLLQPRTCASSSTRPARFAYDLAAYLPSICSTSRAACRVCRPRSRPAARVPAPSQLHALRSARDADHRAHLAQARDCRRSPITSRAASSTTSSLERWLRRSLATHQDAERLPRVRAQDRPAALRDGVRPRHRRARDLRRRRELRAHDLAGGAGVERAADLLQARAHQRRRLRRRRRPPHREHRRRDREGRRSRSSVTTRSARS